MENYRSGFHIVATLVDEVKTRRNLPKASDAFYFVGLKYYLQENDEDKIADMITDLSYVQAANVRGGNVDMGIDAVCIRNGIVYLFNFKYSSEFKPNHNFPSDETNKILRYLSVIKNYRDGEEYHFNNKLKAKTQEIINRMREDVVHFKIVLVSNYGLGLEQTKKVSFESQMKDIFQDATLDEISLSDILAFYLDSKREKTSGTLCVDPNCILPYTSNDDVDLLVFKAKASDVLKLFLTDDALRQRRGVVRSDEIIASEIDESFFDDNVRIFLETKNKVNEKIILTAKKHPEDFFFYNNGVTIVSDSCKVLQGGIIKLVNYQAVNGGQTLHSLFFAARKEKESIEKAELLCRIFSVSDREKKSNIARYTNSQTAVSERDIASLSYVQDLLHAEFLQKGLFFERKKNQYKNQPAKKRYDSQHVGQLIMAFRFGKPNIARSNTRAVFSDEWIDKIFSEDITAEYIILLDKLFKWLKTQAGDKKSYCKNSWLYILYFFRLAYEKYELDGGELNLLSSEMNASPSVAEQCAEVVFHALKYIVDTQTNLLGTSYVDSNFFKKEEPITVFKSLLSANESPDGILQLHAEPHNE